MTPSSAALLNAIPLSATSLKKLIIEKTEI